MTGKDMERSTWTRVTEKKQIIRDFACRGHRGKISLLRIDAVTAPMLRTYEGRDIVLADAGYYWLQLAIEGGFFWFTAMFGPDGRFIQVYADVTDGNRTDKDDPDFDDLYLDYVLYGGRVYELDRDELEEALASGDVTPEQYGTAVREGERVRRDMAENAGKIEAFFTDRFAELKEELERE